MQRWVNRYFILNGPKLIYKMNADSPAVRGAFDLSLGCVVTEVSEESMVAIKAYENAGVAFCNLVHFFDYSRINAGSLNHFDS